MTIKINRKRDDNIRSIRHQVVGFSLTDIAVFVLIAAAGVAALAGLAIVLERTR